MTLYLKKNYHGIYLLPSIVCSFCSFYIKHLRTTEWTVPSVLVRYLPVPLRTTEWTGPSCIGKVCTSTVVHWSMISHICVVTCVVVVVAAISLDQVERTRNGQELTITVDGFDEYFNRSYVVTTKIWYWI